MKCTEHPQHDGSKKPIERWQGSTAPGGYKPRNITCERCWIIYLTKKEKVIPK